MEDSVSDLLSTGAYYRPLWYLLSTITVSVFCLIISIFISFVKFIVLLINPRVDTYGHCFSWYDNKPSSFR